MRGADAGPLFLPVNKSGKIQARRMNPRTGLDILQRLVTGAGVTRFSSHDTRRTLISDLLGAGADISTVQRLAGHANVQTTARYRATSARGEATKRRAVELLHVPYSEAAPEAGHWSTAPPSDKMG